MNVSVLFVTTVATTLEAFLVPFAERYRSLGWKVDALANGAASNPRIKDSFDERFDISWSRNPLDPRNLMSTASRIRNIVGTRHYDIVHVHTPIAAFVTRYALRRVRRWAHVSVIYTAHGFHFYKGQAALPHAVYRTMERVAARWTDYLVTINQEDYEAARGFGTIPPERVRYIPGIGVDTDRYSPGSVTPEQVASVRSDFAVAPDAFLVTMVAEFGPVKNHALALKALALVNDPRVVLAFVGEGPLLSDIQALAEQLGVAHKVRFPGYRQDIAAVFAASDAALQVSEREGLNRSVLEAMACGRPVIGTNTRGIADAVGGEAWWIVPKNDAAAIAAAIDGAAADPEQVARRGEAARQRATTEFSLAKIMDLHDGLYHEALASRF